MLKNVDIKNYMIAGLRRLQTEKVMLGCNVYLNATQAGIRTGYSKKTARKIGQENLRKPEIKTYIDATLARLQAENVVGKYIGSLNAVQAAGMPP